MKKIHFLLIALVLTPFMFYAQDSTGIQEVGAAAGPKPGEEVSAFEFIMKGGPFLIPIVILLFYTIYVAIERYRYITRMAKYNPALMSEVKMSLSKGNIQDAASQADRYNTSYGAVVSEGILTVGRPVSEIEGNMEKVVNIEIGKMEKSMGHLGLIAGIAPTFGFIGTIAGVIKIFYEISISSNVSISNISGGLYEKMICSGAGLTVGILAYSAYHLLNGLIDGFALKVQRTNLEFVNLIQRPS